MLRFVNIAPQTRVAKLRPHAEIESLGGVGAGYDWSLSDKTSWSLTAKYYFEKDHVPSNVTPSPSLPTLYVALGEQYAHPFDYQGLQLMSTFSVKF